MISVCIRADASTLIGTGHIVRCLTLAKRLSQKGSSVSFFSREIPGHLCASTEKAGFRTERLSDADNDLPSGDLLQRYNQKPDWLIVDHYELDARWEQSARARAVRIFVIDDLADRPHDCDALLDQNFYPDVQTRYRSRVPENCRLLLGPRFALLRDEFLARGTVRERTGAVERILVFLGGADQSNETAKVLLALKKLGRPVFIDVVAGPTNPHKEGLLKLCRTLPKARFYDTTPSMADLMEQADLAIGGGGTTSWERCYMGVPTLAIVTAENQREMTQALHARGASINLGWHEDVTSEQIAGTVRLLMDDPQALRTMTQAAREVIGGPSFQGTEASSDLIMEKRYAAA